MITQLIRNDYFLARTSKKYRGPRMSTHPFWSFRYRDQDFRPIVTSTEDGQSVVQYSLDNEVGQMAPMPTESRFIQNILRQLAEEAPVVAEEPEAELEDVPAGGLLERVQEFIDEPDSQLVFAPDEADAPSGREILESLFPHITQQKMMDLLLPRSRRFAKQLCLI